MKKIINLLDGPLEIQITHVYWEADRCADMLANMGSEGISEIDYFENPPTRVLQIIEDDARGVSFPPINFLVISFFWAQVPLNTKKKKCTSKSIIHN
jgi:hypothetical protein